VDKLNLGEEEIPEVLARMEAEILFFSGLWSRQKRLQRTAGLIWLEFPYFLLQKN